MPKLNWNGNDFRNSQDSSGTVADNISRNGNLQQGYNHGSLMRGLVAYYPMEKGQGEVLHDGALDNLGQIKGASWNETGQVGSNAIKFDGTGENVSVGNISADSLGSWTVAYWAMPSSSQSDSSTWSGLVSNGDANNDGDWSCHYKHDVTDWVITHSGDYPYNSGLNVTANALVDQWQLIVWTYDGSKIRIYRDGELKDSGTGSQKYGSNLDNINIGKYIWQGDDRYWNGKIDDIRIYNRTLSQPEIKALYSLSQPSGVERKEKNVPGQSEGGISRYKLNGKADDDWGSNNGENNGADLTATGAYGQAAQFNGSSDYISISNNSTLDIDYVTVSWWTKHVNITDDYEGYFSHDGDWTGSQGTPYGAHLRRSGLGDGIQWRVRVGGTSYRLESGSDTYPEENKWNHWACSYDGEKMYIYKNGELVATNNSPSGKLDDLEKDLLIGVRESAYMNGKIDDVRIYNKALIPVQIEKLYHKGAYRISRESTLQ